MNKAVKKRWVAALRSKHYRTVGQTRGKLCGDEGMCCLGVLLDSEVVGYWEEEKAGRYSINVSGVIETDRLPHNYRKSIDLLSADMEVLIDLNDDQHRSFREIAKWIEKNL